MRVFLDTNVLASAVATRGLCADVLREVLTSHKLVTSKQVLSELRRALKIKSRVPKDVIDEFIWLMRQDAALANPEGLPAVKLADKGDLPILAAAMAGRADAFITGDKELLAVRHVDGLVIISPRQFWERLKAEQKRRAVRQKPRRLS